MVFYLYERSALSVLRRKGLFSFKLERLMPFLSGEEFIFPEKDRGKTLIVGLKLVKVYSLEEAPSSSMFKLADAVLMGKRCKVGLASEDILAIKKLAFKNNNFVKKLVPVNLVLFRRLRKKYREFALVDFGFNSVNFIGLKGGAPIIITENFGLFDLLDDLCFSKGITVEEAWKAYLEGDDFVKERLFLMLSDSLSNYTAPFKVFDRIMISGPGIFIREKEESPPFVMLRAVFGKLGFEKVSPLSKDPFKNEAISLLVLRKA